MGLLVMCGCRPTTRVVAVCSYDATMHALAVAFDVLLIWDVCTGLNRLEVSVSGLLSIP